MNEDKVEVKKKEIVCKCCGKYFKPRKDIHSVAIEASAKGAVNALVGEKLEMYDVYDCPRCGRQHIEGRRLRYASLSELGDCINGTKIRERVKHKKEKI